MGRFADDVMRYRLKVEGLAEQGLRKVVLDLDTKVIERTPVDTGRARANWHPNIGSEPVSAEGAGDAVAAVAAMLPQLKVGDTAWISNNLPYAPVLEYGLYPNPPKSGTGKTVDGFSTQAPAGMVRISAAEFPDIVAQAKA